MPLALVIDTLFPVLSVNEPELIDVPFKVNAEDAVPDWDVAKESLSTAPDIFKKLSKLLPIAFKTIEEVEPFDAEVIE